jgi:hypothetical protein
MGESPRHLTVDERLSANASEDNVQDTVRTTLERVQLNELVGISWPVRQASLDLEVTPPHEHLPSSRTSQHNLKSWANTAATYSPLL